MGKQWTFSYFHSEIRRMSPISCKVMRVALENAVSVASVLLLTEATMTEPPEM